MQINVNLLSDIEHISNLTPNTIAVRMADSEITYRQLWSTIERIAKNAVLNGLKPGEYFIYCARPSPDSIAFSLGLMRAGLTLVFVDPFSSPNLFTSRVNLVKPSYVVADSILYTLGHKWFAKLRKLRNFNICNFANIHQAKHLYIGRYMFGIPKASLSLKNWAENEPSGKIVLPNIDPLQDAVISFTSGTTGDPKGVVHTFNTLAANSANFALLLNISKGSIVYTEPMTVGAVALSRGATWIIPSTKDLIPQVIDVLFAVPTDLLAIIKKIRQSKNKTPQITTIATGGGPVLPSLLNEVTRTLGIDVQIINVYGMTEMLPVATCNAFDKITYLNKGEFGDVVGAPIGDTLLQIASDGEILVSGSGLMNRYFGKEQSIWHRTGDLGKISNDGTLVLLGRKKNMLIRGKTNIYPSLYEPGISTIPGVSDAVIVGVPDSYGDDLVILFIVPSDERSEDDVLRLVRNNLAIHMDATSFPDYIFSLKQIPTIGRGLKRDMAALKILATDAIRSLGGS